MTRVFLVLVALSAFAAVATAAAAGSPRFRRAFHEEAELSTKSESRLCARKTPCAWSESQYSQLIKNEYCECGPKYECLVDEHDSSASAYIHRCRKPSEQRDIN